MECAEAKLRIEPYVNGKLPDDEKGALESHLEACAECRLDTELTRASYRSPTAAHSPPAPPEPPPPAPSASSWTIDSIFGAPAPATPSSGVAGPSHESAPPPEHPPEGPAPAPEEAAPAEFGVPPAFATTSAQEDSFENVLASEPAPPQEPEPEPEVELPAAFDGPPPSEPSDSRNGDEGTGDPDESSERAGWDFEPADQNDGALPPEGSLFFAEEALGRPKGKKKRKGSFVNVVLGILGGVVGLGLLGASVWIALAMRGELTEQARQEAIREPASSDPAAVPPAPAGGTAARADLGAPHDPSAAPEAAPHTDAPQTTTATDAITATRTVSPEGGQPSPAPPQTATPSKSAAKTTAPPKSAAKAATPTQPPAKTAQALAAEKAARELAALPTPWRNPPPRPAPRKQAPVDDGDDFAPSEMPGITVVKAPVSTPAKSLETPKAAPAGLDSSNLAAIQRTLAPPPPTSAPTAATSAETAAPSVETAAPPVKQAPAADPSAPQNASPEAGQRPVDRLHLATLEAEKNADVDALRKMRDTWRGLVRSSVGPDRARAKRELADCLWAIQTLTSRSSDQKAALAAYRDYVLNAPAGGADSRTVARMRQLEDALSESH